MQLSKLKISSKAFWDVNFNNLMKEYDKYPEFIIKKVFLYGTFQDIIAVYKYFGKQKVINTLTQVSYLPAKTLHFASLFLNIDKSQFKCYTNKRYLRSYSKY